MLYSDEAGETLMEYVFMNRSVLFCVHAAQIPGFFFHLRYMEVTLSFLQISDASPAFTTVSLQFRHLMSIRGSRVVALQAVIENKCGEGECFIGVVKQRGGFLGHLEISSSSCILTV